MPPWNKKRAARVRRRPDGAIKEWTGGRTLSTLPKQRNDFQGIATHIGELFAREHGRPARVGDLHRTRTTSGQYPHYFWPVPQAGRVVCNDQARLAQEPDQDQEADPGRDQRPIEFCPPGPITLSHHLPSEDL